MKGSPAGPLTRWPDVHGTTGRMLVEQVAGCRGIRILSQRQWRPLVRDNTGRVFVRHEANHASVAPSPTRDRRVPCPRWPRPGEVGTAPADRLFGRVQGHRPAAAPGEGAGTGGEVITAQVGWCRRRRLDSGTPKANAATCPSRRALRLCRKWTFRRTPLTTLPSSDLCVEEVGA